MNQYLNWQDSQSLETSKDEHRIIESQVGKDLKDHQVESSPQDRHT